MSNYAYATRSSNGMPTPLKLGLGAGAAYLGKKGIDWVKAAADNVEKTTDALNGVQEAETEEKIEETKEEVVVEGNDILKALFSASIPHQTLFEDSSLKEKIDNKEFLAFKGFDKYTKSK